MRGVHESPSSVVSKSPIPCTIAQKRDSSSPSNISADSPRCPGGWFAGSSQPSLPGSPESVDSSPHVSPPSRLSKIPGASTPASTRPGATASAEIFDNFRAPSPYEIPSLESDHVSPRSGLRQTAEPCHSLAPAA